MLLIPSFSNTFANGNDQNMVCCSACTSLTCNDDINHRRNKNCVNLKKKTKLMKTTTATIIANRKQQPQQHILMAANCNNNNNNDSNNNTKRTKKENNNINNNWHNKSNQDIISNNGRHGSRRHSQQRQHHHQSVGSSSNGCCNCYSSHTGTASSWIFCLWLWITISSLVFVQCIPSPSSSVQLQKRVTALLSTFIALGGNMTSSSYLLSLRLYVCNEYNDSERTCILRTQQIYVKWN
uniref:Uncharacterized protein n=1 Tax=Glossina palpalis gambiensis TaxID=67801 RepID=A0A1B0BY53_9MUSC